jgi:hypothetical protein
VPGKTARDAIEVFAGFLNETLSCITDRKLVAFQDGDNTFKLLYTSPIPISTANGNRFYLEVTQICNAVELEDGTFKARTREYSYVFSASSAHTDHGILAYHWHPHESAVRIPHLHLKVTVQTGTPVIEGKISRAHFPTSRVCLEDFVYLLVKYYDIKSQLHHNKFRSILERNKREFSKGATWTVRPPS